MQVTDKMKALGDDGKDAHGIITELNGLMGSCAESCNLTKKEKSMI